MGRKPELNQQDRTRLHLLLLNGPAKVGRKTPKWTCLRVADLIRSEFGVRYHVGHAWKILISLGWSPQRPSNPGNDRKENETLSWKCNI